MGTFITSSAATSRWLNKIRTKSEERNPSLLYSESNCWVSFKCPSTNRSAVYLQPQKSQIRLFTRLNPSFDGSIQPTPSSIGYAERYPLTFLIKYENSIDKAVELIIAFYEEDLRK